MVPEPVVAPVVPDVEGVLPGSVAVVDPDDGTALPVNGFVAVLPLVADDFPAAGDVPRGLLEVVLPGLVDEVERGVLEALGLVLGLLLGLVLGLLLGFGLGVVLGFGVELGRGALTAAGGAVSGFPPDPKANPRTVPGAGL